jgi:lipoprotein-releasing system ATP-binding protein
VAETGRAQTLRIEGLRKSYGLGTPVEAEVLHGIDLSLGQGEFTALIGPSGSGKTTLLNLIGLLDQPDAGRLVIAGQDTRGLTEADITRLRGRTIGFIFQYHYLLPAFTALENVMMPALAARGKIDDEMRATAAALLDKVGLTRWRDSKATEISGGQQQRVAIARALAMNPLLVLADEPSGNLDTENADAVFDMMRDVNQSGGTTFLIVTHDPRLAQRCDRIIELVDGRIVADKQNPHVLRRG